MVIAVKNYLPFERSSDVTFPWSWISFDELSELLVSQNLIFLSKCPLIMVDESVVTRSLQLDPANFVSMHALLRKSQIFKVRSCDPVMIFCDSPTNFAAITFPECPVSVCWKDSKGGKKLSNCCLKLELWLRKRNEEFLTEQLFNYLWLMKCH